MEWPRRTQMVYSWIKIICPHITILPATYWCPTSLPPLIFRCCIIRQTQLYDCISCVFQPQIKVKLILFTCWLFWIVFPYQVIFGFGSQLNWDNCERLTECKQKIKFKCSFELKKGGSLSQITLRPLDCLLFLSRFKPAVNLLSRNKEIFVLADRTH